MTDRERTQFNAEVRECVAHAYFTTSHLRESIRLHPGPDPGERDSMLAQCDSVLERLSAIRDSVK